MLKGVGKGQGKDKGAGVGNTYVDPGRPEIFQPTGGGGAAADLSHLVVPGPD